MLLWSHHFALIIVGGFVLVLASCADHALLVVASIEETAERYHIPKPFIGLILIPIVVSERRLVTIINLNNILGQCCRACQRSLYGIEGQNGSYHYHLCRQLHRRS